MNDIDKIKKHLTGSQKLVLKNEDGTEDIFELKPLTMAQQTMAFSIGKTIRKNQTDGTSNEELAESMDDETMNDMLNLLKSVVKNSFEGIDDESAENFVLTNYDVLVDTLEKLIPKSQNSKKADELNKRIEQRKEILNNAK